MIWFSAALASSAVVMLGVSAWATDTGYVIGALATAIVSVIGGYKSLRRANKRDIKETVAPAVAQAVAPAVTQAIKDSEFPTDPTQLKQFARLVAVEWKKIQDEEKNQPPKVQT